MALVDDLRGIFLVFRFSGKRKHIFGFSIGYPIISSSVQRCGILKNSVLTYLVNASSIVNTQTICQCDWRRTHRNHSYVARIRPGWCLSTSSISLSLEARGSLTSTTITFQSVSPSSRRAITPRTLTCFTWPTKPTCSPISHTSNGSLSPFALVSA